MRYLSFSLFSFYLFTSPAISFASEVIDEETFVTATKHAERIVDIHGAAVVIDKADIFVTQPAEVPEILEYQSGAQIVRAGGRTSQTSLFTRGTNSDHTLVLIDGMRMGSVTNGQAQLQFIDPEQIERVEFYKGPRSSLYGSDALGGVIQIFTLTPPEEREAYITAQAGSENTQRLAGGIKDKKDKLYYSAAISHEKSDGMDNIIDDSGYNSDDDPYKITSGNIGVGYVINESTDISLRHFENRSEADYDSYFSGSTTQPYVKDHQRSTSILFKSALTEVYSTQVNLGHAKEDSENLDRQAENVNDYFDTERSNAFWLNSFAVSELLHVDLGLDYTDESVDSSTIYDRDSRDNSAVFTQVKLEQGGYSFQFGVREDDSSDFGKHTTSNATFGVSVTESTNLYASWGEGFKAPSFNDLYWPYSGNRDLLPESSEAFEIGMKAEYSNLYYAVSLYQQDIDNLIDWAPDASGENWLPNNINAAEIKGAELDVSADFAGLNLDTTLSYTDAKDANTDELLDNRAKKKFTLNLSKTLGDHTLGLLFKAASERRTSTGNTLPGHGIVGMFITSNLSEHLVVRFKVNNLLDKEYNVNERYNAEALNANAKVTYKF